MNLVTIPVAPLTRKVIMVTYPVEPIILNSRDLLFDQLRYKRTHDVYHDRMREALTTYLTFSVHRHMAEEINHDVHRIGYHLYQLHKTEMFRFVWAQAMAGEKELWALQRFYSVHGIDEDDFSMETAYREWKRWKTAAKNRLYFSPSDVPRNITDIPPPPARLLDIARRTKLIAPYFIPTIDKRVLSMLECLLLIRYGKLKQNEAARLLKRTQPSVCRTVSRAEQALQYYPALHQVIDYCLRTAS